MHSNGSIDVVTLDSGDFVEDVDIFTAATLRANKMFSAMMDGLNWGIYTKLMLAF